MFVALNADTKLAPAYCVGKCRRRHAVAFMTDLPERLANRPQLSSNADNCLWQILLKNPEVAAVLPG